MTLAFISLGVFNLLGLLIWLPHLWKARKILACVAIIGVSVSVGAVFGHHPSPWSAALVFLAIYQLINLLRLVEGRTGAQYLYRPSKNTMFYLLGAQLTVLIYAALNQYFNISAMALWYVAVVLQIAAAATLYKSTLRSLQTTKPPTIKQEHADRDLPTLTVAIPARNETQDLENCLKALVRSDYPKLEILVLDDCSQNKQTPEIIRNYAHDGVRFISGDVPPERWLAKNFAYQRLTEEANGNLILFCGVDTRFENNSLRLMVELLLQKDKQMLSILPKNPVPGQWHLEDMLVQPGRYAWELALPRRMLDRPPVLSTCWLITSKTLKAAGSFKAVARSGSPESFFARYCVTHDDSYSFIATNNRLGLRSVKQLSQQRATAIRTRYLQVHRRPELVAFMSITEFSLLVLPFITWVVAFVHHEWLLAIFSFIAAALTTITYSKIVELTYRKFLWRSILVASFAALYDIGLLNYSMWRYEFREVIWKGRNVCIPVMQVISELPKLK